MKRSFRTTTTTTTKPIPRPSLPSSRIDRRRQWHQAMSISTMEELISGTWTWNTVIGEADRAFRQGLQLDKAGQPRAANSAFHEAATLYQCFLELEDCFNHVSNLRKEEMPPLLAYTLVRLAFLSMDALGDPKAAIRLYTMASVIDPNPSSVCFKGMGTAIEAAGGNGDDLEHLKQAVVAYRQSLDHYAHQPNTAFQLAVAAERLGKAVAAERIMESLQRSEAPISCLVDSWGYVRWHTRKVPPPKLNLYRGTRDMLQLALDAAMPLIEQQRENPAYGLVCEFGVGSGRSLRMTQELLPLDIAIHGFDTFTGLPQAWGDEPAGTYSTGGIVPNMEGKVYFHKGLFKNTIPQFLDVIGNDAFLAYANIDCDLYTSTLDILEAFHGRIVEGTILIFDEYICHPSWRQDEFRAWRECCKRFGWQYEYLGFSLSSKQAVVRVTAVA